ncbi:heavy metal translocating P-type ATPase [delta proteobacterium NaphS2]|nr:heavy metal translocating P-type ATPase [delta proteobacterium NaphS2]
MAHHPEIDIRLCHAVPGRVRFRIPELRSSRVLADFLKNRLMKREDVEHAETRLVTGSLIIRYDEDKITGPDFVEALQSQLPALVTRDLTKFSKDYVVPSEGKRKFRLFQSLGFYLLNAVALSGFMAFLFLRRLILGASISQGPLSLTGLAAMFGAIPLFLRASQDLVQKERMGLFPFLSVSAVLAIFTGEALAALEILWILSIGTLLEAYATERARKSVLELLEVTPDRTFVLSEQKEIEISSREIRVGQTVVVHAGMMIPVDGRVLKGEGLVDTSQITGRAKPEMCRKNNQVFAGTRVQQGSFHIRADRLGEETFLARIRHLVEISLSQPTIAEKRADVLTARLTKLGLIATFFTFILTRSFSRTFSVMLVMACPCATVLAASTAVAAAIANAARHRILIKGGVHLEQLPNIDVICFDKTGTLTAADLCVTTILTRAPGQPSDRVLQLAASAEALATHPMATALITEARRRNLELTQPTQTDVSLGRGVSAVLGKDAVLVGNEGFLESNGIKTNYYHRKAVHFRSSGQSVVYVAKNGRLQGIIAIHNSPRPGLSTVLDRLKEEGHPILYLVSGDSESVVQTMAAAYDFDNYRGDLLPHEKSDLIKKMRGEGKRVMMVGDGVNDALVLSDANIGVSMGAGGSDVAVEAADIVLLRNDLNGLLFLKDLSKKTLQIVDQNFWLATLTNAIGIIMAVPGWMPPAFSGVMHVGHSLGILINSGRILKWAPETKKILTSAPS